MPERIIAIGDVHGCLAPFDALLTAIDLQADDHLVLLGDCIDRGPDSAGVPKRILRLRQTSRVSYIRGNHEEMLLAARTSQTSLAEWTRYGGDATLRSYGGVRGSLRDIPGEHWRLFEEGLVDSVETPTHLLVHAGLDPTLPLHQQPPTALRWQRFDTLAPHVSGKTIICGHTPQTAGRPTHRGFAICLDTHAFGGGPLTALELPSHTIYQAQPTGRVERSMLEETSSTGPIIGQ